MALEGAIPVVEALEGLKAGNHLRVRRVTVLNIRALAMAHLGLRVETDDIRDTLAAAYFEVKLRPYGFDVGELNAALEPGGVLQQLAQQAREDLPCH